MTKIAAPVSNLLQIYTEATEMMHHGVMWINEEGHILHVNSRLIRELGYTREDFSTKTIFQISPYINFITWRNHWKDLLRDGKIAFNTEHLAVDGTIRPMKMRGVLIDTGGQKMCVSIVESELLITPYIDLLQLLSEMLNAGGWQWTIVDNSYFFTRELYRLLELPEETKIDKDNIEAFLQEHLPDRDFLLLKEKMTQAVKAGIPFEIEIAIKLPVSQRTKQFSLKGLPFYREGKAIKIYGTLQDISTLSARTEELYLTQYSVDNAQEIILWIAPDGSIHYVNDYLCKLLGYTKEEVLQSKYPDILIGFDEKQWQNKWDTLRQEKALHTELVFSAKGGDKVPALTTANHMDYRGVELACVFGRDLRAKKRRDQLIKMASHTVRQAKELIYWLDGNGTFVFVNEAFCEKLGFKQEEIIGKNVQLVYPDYSVEKGWEKLRAGQNIEGEYFITSRRGERIPVEVSETLILHDGGEYCCGVLRDITDRKRKEEALRSAFEENRRLKEQLELDNRVLKNEIALEYNFNNIISTSDAYKKVLKQVEQVADTEATVLILGETGTGKELLARALHQLSRRADRPMVKVNCGALPDNLIESELFGHEKGAFTGAYQQKKGRFELADKGSIFLDEIGELPLELQSKLLRVLQEGEFERVGGTQTVQVDVRVIAATNRNLEQQVQAGKFRQDLFYRLNVFPIYNIPLRDRRDDIPLLIRHYTEKFCQKTGKNITTIPQSVLDKLTKYDFPGNVRELENIIERAVILSTGPSLQVDTSFMQSVNGKSTGNFKTLEEMQREHILDALRRSNGQVSGEEGAAKLLNINDKTLHSKMKKLKIERLDYLTEDAM